MVVVAVDMKRRGCVLYILKVELTGFADGSNEGRWVRESTCYEYTLEELTQSSWGAGVSVVVKSKDSQSQVVRVQIQP